MVKLCVVVWEFVFIWDMCCFCCLFYECMGDFMILIIGFLGIGKEFVVWVIGFLCYILFDLIWCEFIEDYCEVFYVFNFFVFLLMFIEFEFFGY